MTINGFAPLVLSAAIALSASAGLAQSTTETLGDKLSSGRLSEAAFVQLVDGAGVSVDEARDMTLQDVARIKWQDD